MQTLKKAAKISCGRWTCSIRAHHAKSRHFRSLLPALFLKIRQCWPITSVGGRLESPRGPATPATVNHRLLFPIVPGLGDICHTRRIGFWSATLNYWFLAVVAQNVIFSKVSRIYAGQQFAVPLRSIIQRGPRFHRSELFICWRSVDINSANTGGKMRKILSRPLRLFSGYKTLI